MNGPRAPFPHKTDWWHFTLGFLAGLLIHLYPPVAWIICTVYLIYQFTEKEGLLDTYLDIETTSVSIEDAFITVIGLYTGDTVYCFMSNFEDLDGTPPVTPGEHRIVIAPIHRFEEVFASLGKVVTFNGTTFDLPIIRNWFPLLDYDSVIHLDLKFALRSLGIRGGLKKLEKIFGIERPESLDGLNGKDAVNLAGYVGSNILEGEVQVFHTEQIDRRLQESQLLLDVRTEAEFHRGHIEQAVNIPVDDLRNRLEEIPRDRTLLVYCLTGIRSYYACRMLRQVGFRALNLSGGYMVYCATRPSRCKGIPGLHRWKRTLAMETFCSTPEERQILKNHSARRLREQEDHAVD